MTNKNSTFYNLLCRVVLCPLPSIIHIHHTTPKFYTSHYSSCHLYSKQVDGSYQLTFIFHVIKASLQLHCLCLSFTLSLLSKNSMDLIQQRNITFINAILVYLITLISFSRMSPDLSHAFQECCLARLTQFKCTETADFSRTSSLAFSFFLLSMTFDQHSIAFFILYTSWTLITAFVSTVGCTRLHETQAFRALRHAFTAPNRSNASSVASLIRALPCHEVRHLLASRTLIILIQK